MVLYMFLEYIWLYTTWSQIHLFDILWSHNINDLVSKLFYFFGST